MPIQLQLWVRQLQWQFDRWLRDQPPERREQLRYVWARLRPLHSKLCQRKLCIAERSNELRMRWRGLSNAFNTDLRDARSASKFWRAKALRSSLARRARLIPDPDDPTSLTSTKTTLAPAPNRPHPQP